MNGCCFPLSLFSFSLFPLHPDLAEDQTITLGAKTSCVDKL
ncbi:hypothetical protein FDUTEX481_06858 [Tolypothrix sp. PCC 7601]|nr:hypothetical protein FDUTEX481_06858 [Tolypothrix sp. PCC 7601]